MALVSLKERGFIFEDDFSTGISARWEITPNTPSRVVYGDTGLALKHGSSRIFMFLKELTSTKEFVLDMKNIYNPTVDGDVGGLIVYAGEDDFIALDEYFDLNKGTAESYPWVRIVRNYNYYYAYWSNNGIEWHNLGSNTLDQLSPKIGVFLEGVVGSDLFVEKIRVIKSTLVTVGNLHSGIKISIVGPDDTVYATEICRKQDTKVQFDVSDLPIPFQGKFVIDTGVEVLEGSTFIDIFGGDFYHFEVSPDLIFHLGEEAIKLNNGVEEFLGQFNQSSNEQVCKVIVRNPLLGAFKNIKVSLAEYLGTDHWDRLIDIANDDGGVPGEWGDVVNIDELGPGVEKFMWAKLKREYDPTLYTSTVYFGLNVSAFYDSN